MLGWKTIRDYDPENPVAISGEYHHVPTSWPYVIRLDYIPKQEDPSTVSIEGFTETSQNPPNAGEFYVDYEKGLIYFNAANAGAHVFVGYNAIGSFLWAQGINRRADQYALVKRLAEDVVLYAPIDQSGLGVNSVLHRDGTFTGAIGWRTTDDGGGGPLIAQGDDLRLSRGNGLQPAGVDHLGRWLDLDSSLNEYGYIADNAQKGLDPGYGDFLIFLLLKADAISSGEKWIVYKGSSPPYYIVKQIDDGTIRIVWNDGSTTKVVASLSAADGEFHSILYYFDRDLAKTYGCLDGGSTVENDGPSSSVDMDNAASFQLSYGALSQYAFGGQIAAVHVANLGTNPDFDFRKAARRWNVLPDADMTRIGMPEWADAAVVNVVTDGGFEEWNNDTDLAHWSENGTSPGVREITRESAEVHGGSYSVKFTATGNDGTTDFSLYQLCTSNAEAGKQYEVSFWSYYANRTQGRLKVTVSNADYSQDAAIDITSQESGWTRHSLVFTASTTTIRVYVSLRDETNGYAYVDDLSVQRVGHVLHFSGRTSDVDSDGKKELYDETPNGNHLTCYSNGADVDSDTITAPNRFASPRLYSGINAHVGTISVWVRPNWDGDDGQFHYIVDTRVGSSILMLEKSTADKVVAYFSDEDGTLHTIEQSVSGTWSASGLYHVVFRFDTLTGAQDLWLDNSQYTSGNNPLSEREFTDVGTEVKIGRYWYSQDREFDGILSHFHVFDFWLPDTKADAIAQGLPEVLSVEGLYNGGTPIDPPVVDSVGTSMVWE